MRSGRRGWRRFAPDLSFTHPGYAMVTSVLTGVHIAAWTDGAFGGADRHVAPVFRIFDSLGGVALWGWLHAVVAAVMIVGLYHSFRFVHVGFLLSSALYTSTSVAYLASAISEPKASWLGACYAAAFALISWAGMVEPETNPASARPTGGRRDG
jgi:hypothetical protein